MWGEEAIHAPVATASLGKPATAARVAVVQLWGLLQRHG